MTKRMVILAVAGAAVLLAGPATAFDKSCSARGPATQRIVVTFIRKPAFLWFARKCRIRVHPGKKQACAGDKVAWNVVNTCAEEANTFNNIEMTDLGEVIASCEKPNIVQLGPGSAGEIVCTLKTELAPGERKYTVKSDERVLDPELEIVR